MFQVTDPHKDEHEEEEQQVPEEPPFESYAFNPTPRPLTLPSTSPKPPLLVMMHKTVKNPLPKSNKDQVG